MLYWLHSLFFWIFFTSFCRFSSKLLCFHLCFMYYYCQTHYMYIYKSNKTTVQYNIPLFFFLLKSRKKNWAAALSFVIICIIAFTGIFCFIIWIWITVWYHLLLAGRISFIFLVRKVYYQCVLLILVYQECLYFVFILKR